MTSLSPIMTIEDYNQIPEGSILHYKSGGYGWWLNDEDGRQINGSLMWHLHKLGAGMGQAQIVASHQVRFFVETRPVDVAALRAAISKLESIWREFDIRREYQLRAAFAEIKGFALSDYRPPQCYWSSSDAKRYKAFLFHGFCWVYWNADQLTYVPDMLERLRLCLSGGDLAAESRAQMRSVA